MKEKRFDAVKFMRASRRNLARELSRLSGKEQLALLRKRYGHLAKPKEVMQSRYS